MEIREKLGVPDSLRARRDNPGSRKYDYDLVRNQIREYMKNQVGQPINLDDINQEYGWGSTTAQRYVRELMKQGWVSRKSTSKGFGRGIKSVYTVHDTPLPKDERTVSSRKTKGHPKNSEVKVIKPDLPKVEVEKSLLETIDKQVFDFLRDGLEYAKYDITSYGLKARGLIEFSQSLHKAHQAEVAKREAKLKEIVDGRN